MEVTAFLNSRSNLLQGTVTFDNLPAYTTITVCFPNTNSVLFSSEKVVAETLDMDFTLSNMPNSKLEVIVRAFNVNNVEVDRVSYLVEKVTNYESIPVIAPVFGEDEGNTVVSNVAPVLEYNFNKTKYNTIGPLLTTVTLPKCAVKDGKILSVSPNTFSSPLYINSVTNLAEFNFNNSTPAGWVIDSGNLVSFENVLGDKWEILVFNGKQSIITIQSPIFHVSTISYGFNILFRYRPDIDVDTNYIENLQLIFESISNNVVVDTVTIPFETVKGDWIELYGTYLPKEDTIRVSIRYTLVGNCAVALAYPTLSAGESVPFCTMSGVAGDDVYFTAGQINTNNFKVILDFHAKTFDYDFSFFSLGDGNIVLSYSSGNLILIYGNETLSFPLNLTSSVADSFPLFPNVGSMITLNSNRYIWTTSEWKELDLPTNRNSIQLEVNQSKARLYCNGVVIGEQNVTETANLANSNIYLASNVGSQTFVATIYYFRVASI